MSYKTTSNDHVVTDILRVLKCLGLIDYEMLFLEETKSIYQIRNVDNIVRGC